MMKKNIFLLALSLLCFVISGVVVACSVFPTCPEVPLSTLSKGTYIELVPMHNSNDGRVPRVTQKGWGHLTHPYHSAPDMRMDVDREKSVVTVTYKRDGDKIVETWKMGKVTK